MLFSDVELKNLTTFIEVGAKAVYAEKPLQESAAIQTTAIQLIQKLHRACADAAATAVQDPTPAKVE